MDTSVFLARIIGPLFIIIAFSLIINTKDFQKVIKNFGKDFLSIYMSGILAYIIGVLIIANHNIWKTNGFIIITIIGYIVLIKGTSLLLFPNYLTNLIKKIKISKKLLKTIGLLYLILGFYISYLGFFL